MNQPHILGFRISVLSLIIFFILLFFNSFIYTIVIRIKLFWQILWIEKKFQVLKLRSGSTTYLLRKLEDSKYLPKNLFIVAFLNWLSKKLFYLYTIYKLKGGTDCFLKNFKKHRVCSELKESRQHIENDKKNRFDYWDQ